MKIAIYSGEIPSTTFVELLIDGMAKKGYEVILFGRKKKKDYKRKNNISLHCFPESPAGIMLNFIFNFTVALFFRYKALRIVMEEFKGQDYGSLFYKIRKAGRLLIVINHLPDIFHIQWIKQGHEWLFLRKLGVKVIGSFRGAHINYSPIVDERLAEVYRKTFPEYDGFHAVSYAIIDEAIKYNVLKNKIFRIPGAVDPGLLKNEVKGFKLKNNKIQLLSIGRSHWKKGYMYALDVCGILYNSGIDFHYTIVGVDKDEELLYQINDLKIESKVSLIKNIPHNLIFNYYKNADIFLLPSLEEGIANVVLEAMAIGVPVVSTDCGGMKEVIVYGKNGWIVPVRDSLAMAEIIRKIINGAFNINEIVSNARETIRKNHLETKQLSAFGNMYEKICCNDCC